MSLDVSLLKFFKQDFGAVLNKIDELRQLTKQNHEIKLPAVVVIGDQSHGKSSLLEMITGVNLPRGQGMMTRVPLEIRLRKLPDKETNEFAIIAANVQHVSNVQIKDNNKLDIVVNNNTIEKKINSVEGEDISEAIKEYTNIITEENVIADIPIILTIYKEAMPDLTLIDLPGLIRNPKQGEEQLPQQIRDITEKYIRNEESIILNVLQASVDSTSCESLSLSKKYDKKFDRTLLVLTKMDQCEDEGFEQRFQQIQNDEGFSAETIFLTRNRTNKENNEKVSLGEIYNRETSYFENRGDLSHIPKTCVGTQNLTKCLVELQKERILAIVPKLEEKIQKEITYCEKELDGFGKKLISPQDCVRQHYSSLFELFSRLQNEANGMNILYNIQHDDNISENGSDMSDDDKDDEKTSQIKHTKDLSKIIIGKNKNKNSKTLLCAEAASLFDKYGVEVEKNGSVEHILSPKFLQELLEMNKTTKGFTGLPHQVHPMIAVQMINSFIKNIKLPSNKLIDDIHSKVSQTIHKAIDDIYKDYPKLKSMLKDILMELYENDRKSTMEKIDEILQCELTYKFTLSKEYEKCVSQIQSLMNNQNQTQNLKHPTVLKISNISDRHVNGIYYLRSLEKMDTYGTNILMVHLPLNMKIVVGT